MTIFRLILCELAWTLYDQSIKTDDWASYLTHRETCKICRKEKKND